MKSEKGVSLVSLIIYLIVMSITVGIVSRMSNYFYKNTEILDTSLTSSEEFLKFNTYITKEINEKGNTVATIGEKDISSGTMKYVFFSDLTLKGLEYENDILSITLELDGNREYMTNAYSFFK